MIDQLLRSRRGLLVVGAALALVAFALVVVLLNQKSSTGTNGEPTATVGLTTATTTAALDATAVALPSPTISIPPNQAVVAAMDIPAGTKLLNAAAVQKYFKDTPVVGPLTVEDVMTSTELLASQAGTSEMIQIPAPIKRGSFISRQALDVQPLSPPDSLSYQVRPGRVAETIQVPTLSADNVAIRSGDYVDLFLTLYRNYDLSSRTANPPQPVHSGPIQTQQLISGVRVISATVLPGTGGVYMLELTPQDAALVKYVKDAAGQIDLTLLSADDVQTRAASPRTIPVVPEYFITPEAIVRGTPQGNGVPYPFDTPLPTFTPVPTAVSKP
jgi:Flp pilus assembly protein CpaB